MADENIKDFTTTWITFGFLFLALIVFAGYFMAQNNPNALGDSEDNFLILENNLSSILIETEIDANNALNTSLLSSGVSGEDAVRVKSDSNSYSLFKTAKKTYPSAKKLISLVFTGDIGNMISTVFFGIAGLVALFYIIRLGRSIF